MRASRASARAPERSLARRRTFAWRTSAWTRSSGQAARRASPAARSYAACALVASPRSSSTIPRAEYASEAVGDSSKPCSAISALGLGQQPLGRGEIAGLGVDRRQRGQRRQVELAPVGARQRTGAFERLARAVALAAEERRQPEHHLRERLPGGRAAVGHGEACERVQAGEVAALIGHAAAQGSRPWSSASRARRAGHPGRARSRPRPRSPRPRPAGRRTRAPTRAPAAPARRPRALPAAGSRPSARRCPGSSATRVPVAGDQLAGVVDRGRRRWRGRSPRRGSRAARCHAYARACSSAASSGSARASSLRSSSRNRWW